MPIGKFPSHMHGMRHGHIDGVPYFRFWCQKTLPALYDDSLSYYDLLTNVVWYINQLITVAKAYDEKFCELEGLYIELEHYVASYFDKLDVEQTVADILNDMAYSGRLTEIMTTYINDYSIDAKKIKNGFVPVHYEYVKCDENNDYYKRDLTDKEMVEALRHGSVLLGFFNGSPQFGNFIMFMDTFEYDYNGKTIECPCGCCCEHLVQNYKVTYKQAMANKNGKLIQYIVTDEYCKQYAVGYYGKMYADVEDDSITPSKLGKGYTIIIGDDYDKVSDGWSSKLVQKLNLDTDKVVIKSANGAGFVGNGTTYLAQLQSAYSEMTEYQRKNVDKIIVVGGYNDLTSAKNLDSAVNTFSNYVTTNFPKATVYLGMVSWKCNATAGGHKYDTGHLEIQDGYIKAAGDHGFVYMENLPYILHNYQNLDASGEKPNGNGCNEIARAVAISVAGGTYHVSVIGHFMDVTPSDNIRLEPSSMNNLFPGQNQTASINMQQQMIDNTVMVRMNNFHCIEFINPINLVGHMPDGDNGRKGEFDVFSFKPEEGYFEGAEWYGPVYFPCSLKDSSGNVVNADIGLRFEGDKMKAHIYKVTEVNTSSPPGLLFYDFNNVKYIHWSSPPRSWIYDACMC